MQYYVDYRLIRSKRKTIGLEITPTGEVIVRAPYYTSKAEIESFIKENISWIGKHRDKAFDRLQNEMDILSETGTIDFEEIKRLGDRMLKEFTPRIKEYAMQLDVTYARVTVRNQKTRWGSCSSKGNLNFNCLLMLAPIEVQDYVIVHDLCHLIEMNHSKRFWDLVASVLPDYKVRKKWLDNEGKVLMLRAFGPSG